MAFITVGKDRLEFAVQISTLPGCCGVGVAYGLRAWNVPNGKEKLFIKPLADHILSQARALGYSSLVITSIPPGCVRNYNLAFYTAGAEHDEEGINLYKIAKSMRMRTVSNVVNLRTNNTIVTFVKDI